MRDSPLIYPSRRRLAYVSCSWESRPLHCLLPADYSGSHLKIRVSRRTASLDSHRTVSPHWPFGIEDLSFWARENFHLFCKRIPRNPPFTETPYTRQLLVGCTSLALSPADYRDSLVQKIRVFRRWSSLESHRQVCRHCPRNWFLDLMAARS